MSNRRFDPHNYSESAYFLSAALRTRFDEIAASMQSERNLNARIVGLPKRGKTSALLYLQNLLYQRLHREERDFTALPYHIHCQNDDISSFDDFLGKFRRVYADLKFADYKDYVRVDQTALRRIHVPALPGSTGGEKFAALIDALRAASDFARPNNTRLVLLLDNIHAAAEHGWASELESVANFILRADLQSGLRLGLIVTESAFQSTPDEATTLKNEVRRFSDNVWLDPLDEPLLREGLPPRIDDSTLHDIYSYTAGHPWLVQHYLSYYDRNALRSFQPYIPDDKMIEDVFGALLQPRLSDDIKLVNMLIHHRRKNGTADGMTRRELSESARSDPNHVDELCKYLIECGLMYLAPHDARPRQFMIGGMFADWALNFTGSGLFIPAQDGEGARTRTMPPFKLLLSAAHRVIISEGFDLAVDELDQDFNEAIPLLIEAGINITNPRQLQSAATLVNQLFSKKYVEWKQNLADYMEQVGRHNTTGALVFQCEGYRSSDALRLQLLEFPIELTPLDRDDYLALKMPVYKQLVGLNRTGIYQTNGDPFSDYQQVDCLLIALGKDGKLRNQWEFTALPGVYEEINAVANLLTQHKHVRQHAIGTIRIISDDPAQHAASPNVEIVPYSLAALTQALKDPFGLLHYAGHYHFDEREQGDQKSGLVTVQDGQVMLFTERQLKDTLSRRAHPFGLVYLSACQSSSVRSETRTLGIGPAYALLTENTRVVIGMRWALNDHDSMALTQVFYQHLASAGSTPEQALFEARTHLFNHVQPQRVANPVSWAAPIMLT